MNLHENHFLKCALLYSYYTVRKNKIQLFGHKSVHWILVLLRAKKGLVRLTDPNTANPYIQEHKRGNTARFFVSRWFSF